MPMISSEVKWLHVKTEINVGYFTRRLKMVSRCKFVTLVREDHNRQGPLRRIFANKKCACGNAVWYNALRATRVQ